jgi:peptide/nickel transport system substrate-binding protein
MTRLIRPASAGGLSRRGVLRGGAALSAAAMMGPLGATGAFAQASEPKRGGIFRMGIAHGNTSDTLDPGVAEHVFTQVFNQARHGYLTEIGPDGSLVGELAVSWEPSPDAATWTFRLRPGVEYHDGRTVTAEDVIASINYHRAEESTSAVKSLVAPISEMRADGPETVVITLSSGNADFPVILSDYHIPIMPSQDGRVDPMGTVGAGPYVFESFEPGVRATATRFANYWKPNAAWFDGIELLSIVDAAARQNALMSGQVDVIDQVDLPTVHLLERAPGVRIVSLNGGQHFGFPMDTRVAPFDDNNVRMALKYSIDRQELVDKILSGYGTVANDHPINPMNRFYDASLEQREYDPDQARFYLQQAGLQSLDVDLHLADAAFGGAIDAGLLWAEKARAANININVVREPDDGYWSNVWMVKPFGATYWGARPSEDWMFTQVYAAGADWNETFWDHPRFNEILVQARVELDEARRAEMYSEMQRLVRDEGGIVIPMYSNYTMALSDRLGTPETIAANWVLDGFRALERWWFV